MSAHPHQDDESNNHQKTDGGKKKTSSCGTHNNHHANKGPSLSHWHLSSHPIITQMNQYNELKCLQKIKRGLVKTYIFIYFLQGRIQFSWPKILTCRSSSFATPKDTGRIPLSLETAEKFSPVHYEISFHLKGGNYAVLDTIS